MEPAATHRFSPTSTPGTFARIANSAVAMNTFCDEPLAIPPQHQEFIPVRMPEDHLGSDEFVDPTEKDARVAAHVPVRLKSLARPLSTVPCMRAMRLLRREASHTALCRMPFPKKSEPVFECLASLPQPRKPLLGGCQVCQHQLRSGAAATTPR